ncbi:helix-turn-helix domain-containing protein, partial [Patescibacteria group bacterium]
MPSKLSEVERKKLFQAVIGGKLSVKQACAKYKISRTIFYRWLKKYKKTGSITSGKAGRPQKKRKVTLKKFSPLSSGQRKLLVRAILDGKETVAHVCRNFGISRTTAYKWVKRYRQEKEAGEVRLKNREKKVKRYFQQTPQEYEALVLDAVAKYPQFGVKRLVQVLPRIGKTPIVGYHGVQKILERNAISTFESRIAYAQSQVTSLDYLVKILTDFATRLLSLPTKLRVNFVRFSFYTFLSTFATIVALGLGSYWWQALSGQSLSTNVGLTVATMALACGSFFFIYSLKYYLTLALVLSFSRGTKDEEEHQGQFASQLGFGGLVEKVFGVGIQVREKRALQLKPSFASQAPGLTPDLSSVRLERHPFISVQLPMFNEKRVAERLLKACAQMNYPNFEILVCDDSTDETTAIVERFARQWNSQIPKSKSQKNSKFQNPNSRPKIRILHRRTRAGFKGAALAHALKKVNPRTEFVVVFDADFVPYPDTLEQFAKYFQVAMGGL